MKTISSFIPPIFLMILIFISSSIPMGGNLEHGSFRFLTSLSPKIQNLLHIPLYGSLGYFWLNSFGKVGVGISKQISYSIIITLSYGILDEFHQTFIPGRYGSLTDILLNTTGCLVGFAVFYLLKS